MLPTETPFGPGSSGRSVFLLQKVLIQLGHMQPSDIRWGQGFYGPRTTAAVTKVSEAIGCPNNGVFTDRVRAQLLKELARKMNLDVKKKAVLSKPAAHPVPVAQVRGSTPLASVAAATPAVTAPTFD